MIAILQREITFLTSCLFHWRTTPFKSGCALKGKNLLLRRKLFLLTFDPVKKKKNEAKIKTAQLFPLKVYPFALNADIYL